MKRVDKLVAELDSDNYGVREKATKELIATGELAIVPLQKLLEKEPSREAERRAQMILKKVKEPVLTPDRLRALEAIELLEQLRSPEAKRLLEEIAREALIVQLRQEAVQALQRLDRAAEEK